jgi:hypothetical protein
MGIHSCLHRANHATHTFRCFVVREITSMGAVLRRCDVEYDSVDPHQRHRARSAMNQIIESTTTTKIGSTELTQIHLTPLGEELLTARRIAEALTSPYYRDPEVGALKMLLVKKRGAATKKCNLPPKGWKCNLPANHDGPCPAWPDAWRLRLKYAIKFRSLSYLFARHINYAVVLRFGE